MSLKKFRDAGLTKKTANGTERFYIQNNQPDPLDRRVYCVIANDMSINELVPMTPKEFMMLKLSKGDQLTIEDWTETFNIQPKDLDILAKKNPIYGASASNRYTYKTLMQYGTSESI